MKKSTMQAPKKVEEEKAPKPEPIARKRGMTGAEAKKLGLDPYPYGGK